MKIAVTKAEKMLREILATTGAEQKDIDHMVTLHLSQDLHQNFFSGLGEADDAVKVLQDSKGKQQTTEVDMPSLKLINGNGRSAKLVAMDAIPMLCDMAKSQGVAIVGIYNAGYHGSLDTYCRAIAAQGLVGICSANGGPQGVVPFGGSKAVLGTNPISYGIPTNDMPIVFDGATSKYPYGAIKHAKARNEQLPKDSFLDAQGSWTTDPNKAVAIIPFGEHKGYAINLLLDVMTGCMVRAKSGLQQHSEAELGGFLMAINPAAFGPLDEFKAATAELAKDIESVPPAAGYKEVHTPGWNGERHARTAIKNDELTIDDHEWEAFEAAYKKYVAR